MTDFKTIYNHLKEGGFDVYSMGQHKGVCRSPYCVVKNHGADLVYSVSDRLYEVMMYYPAARYSEFEAYIDSVKRRMAELWPFVRLSSDESDHYMDDEKQAYMSFILYRAPRVAKYITGTD